MEINNFNLKKEATVSVTPYYYCEDTGYVEEDTGLDMIHHVGTFYDEESEELKLSRTYFSFQIPDIPKNAEIVSAVLHLKEHSAEVSNGVTSYFSIYDEPGGFENNFNAFKEYNCAPISFYAFSDTSIYRDTCEWFIDIDITKYIKQKVENGISRCYFTAKLENETSQDEVSFCRYTGGNSPHTISISYNTSYNYNTENDAITHEIGNLGRASIDVKTGNLRFCLNDFSYNGLRMPVQINHLYNSALCNERYTANNINRYLPDFSAMNIGLGFKLDLMEGSNSEKTFDGYTCTYDNATRLVKITGENGDHINITYTDGRITKVTDGAGREFVFGYENNGYLTSITAPDMTQTSYTYTEGLLTEINYPSGNNTLKIAYNNDKLPVSFTIVDSNNTNVYKIEYTYLRNKVSSVREYGYENGAWVAGAESTIAYYPAEDRTIIESTEQTDSGDESKIITVYTGNGKYVYTKDTGSDGVTLGSGINPYMGDGGAGLICVVDNMLTNPGLDSFTGWTLENESTSGVFSATPIYEEELVKHGRYAMRLYSYNNAVTGKGIYQTTPTLPAGEYTFSAYCMIHNEYNGTNDITPGVYLRVTDSNGNILAETEHLNKADGEFIRLVAPFKIVNEQGQDQGQAVTVHILSDGQGVAFADAAQLERNVYANVYNMISNSNFENEPPNWTLGQGADINLGTCFNMEHSLKITGNIHEKRNAYQDLGNAVKHAEGTRESFTLSGWAKCENGMICGSSIESMESRFGLRAVIEYTDGTSEEYTAPFSPITNEWHRSEISFAKQEFKFVNTIKIYCDFDHSSGTAYFDDIMLVQDYVEYGLTAEDFEDQSEDTSNSTDDDESEEQWPTLEDGMVPFYEVYDEHGNQRTSMKFCRTLDDPEIPSVIYREYTYSADGNNLIGESDERGRFTTYTVDTTNSRVTEKTDREGNKTAYEYDSAGKTTKVTAKKANGTEVANVSYGYDSSENMNRITRGDGMRYDIEYNPFGDIKTIGINGKSESLVSYTYKEKNGRLKEIGYANGDKAKLFYNSAGSLIAERWYNINNEDIAHYKYVYDSEGNIIRSVDILGKKEYTYLYGDNGISCVTEYDITVSGENVTSRQLKNKIRNFYNEDGKLYKKRIGDRDIFYTHTDNENSSTRSTATDGNVTATIVKDGLGRKDTEEVTLGNVKAGRWFEYADGHEPSAYSGDYLPEAYVTSNLVSRMCIYSDGIYRYTYDNEDRITKVTGPDTTINYTYDSQGQLLTEKCGTYGNIPVNTMTYDAYGNILTKNGKAYVYDTVWKDLLLSYGGQSITYDAQGNPTNYLGHTLTWEKGRQLKSFDSNTYTYNANGIRTSKTVGGIKHEYILEGSKILKETWGNNTLVPIYDAENSVVGIKYNDVPYLFQRNLQNDIVGIVDSTGTTIVKYSYDAWGVCTVTSDTSGINLSAINPYRYRSYYYDTEIGLYYLQSRYYDPVVGRFICGDEPICLAVANTIVDLNLFSYCGNETITSTDHSGYFKFKAWILAAALDSVFALLNAAMMAGYISFSLTIMMLSKSWFTLRYATVLFGTVVKTFVYGIYNTVMTVLRTVLWRIAGVSLNFLTGKVIDSALSYLGDNLSAVISSLLSWGGLIAGIIDWGTDKSLDGWIVI